MYCAQKPIHINLSSPRSTLFHFYALEIFCVTVGSKSGSSWKMIHIHTTSEVDQFQTCAVQCVFTIQDKEIVWLYVSVNDVTSVQGL